MPVVPDAIRPADASPPDEANGGAVVTELLRNALPSAVHQTIDTWRRAATRTERTGS